MFFCHTGWMSYVCTSKSILITSVIVVLIAFFIWLYTSGSFLYLLYYINFPFSKGLPSCPSMYVGRANESEELLRLMGEAGKIIHILGPPGFGKSTLAICVGNTLITKGVVVRYIDLGEVSHQPVQQIIAEKILFQESTHSDMINVTFDHLLSWSQRRIWNNVVIFDNCDNLLNNQKDQFNEAVEKLVKQSNKIKILITSREETLYVEESRALKLDTLRMDEACELLDRKSPGLLNTNEKVAMVNLTGGVPLALQIVGSLLNKPLNPPTPATIIEELRNQPIPTLSPINLNKKLRINASISVSYNYLGYELKAIARNLANFPGSFNKHIASKILRSVLFNHISDLTDDIVSKWLDGLVTRSLLEFNTQSERYHFHHLIKEFFRDVQLNHHRQERWKFVLAFQLEISHTLKEWTFIFTKSPKAALRLLDKDRHNVQYLLKVTHHPFNCSHRAYVAATEAIEMALAVRFLTCRFSAEQLFNVTSSITYVLRGMVRRAPSQDQMVLNCSLYFPFISHQADIVSELEGHKAAAEWLLAHVELVEEMDKLITDPQLQNRLSSLYTNFYINLLAYEQFFDEARIRLYNTRVLNKTIELQPDRDVDLSCQHAVDMCPYKDIATAYFAIRDYQKSKQYFEKALKSKGLGLSLRVTLGVYLVRSYQYTGEHDKADDAFQRTVNSIYASVLQYPSTLIIPKYRQYVCVLREFGETQKAIELERKELHELLETGVKGGITESFRAYDFAYHLYHQGNYTEAISMARLALEFAMQTLQTVERIKFFKLELKLLIGKAYYKGGNSSGSIVVFKEIADWIIQHNATNQYEDIYLESCSYLKSDLKYLYKCYIDKYTYIGHYLIGLLYYMFEPPLDLYDVNEDNTIITKFNHFDELMSESGLKDIILRAQSKDFPLSTFRHTQSDSETKPNQDNHIENHFIVKFLDFACSFALQFVIVRVVINLFAVVIKVTFFGSVMTSICVLCCCGVCCGSCCCCCCCQLIVLSIRRVFDIAFYLYFYCRRVLTIPTLESHLPIHL